MKKSRRVFVLDESAVDPIIIIRPRGSLSVTDPGSVCVTDDRHRSRKHHHSGTQVRVGLEQGYGSPDNQLSEAFQAAGRVPYEFQRPSGGMETVCEWGRALGASLCG